MCPIQNVALECEPFFTVNSEYFIKSVMNRSHPSSQLSLNIYFDWHAPDDVGILVYHLPFWYYPLGSRGATHSCCESVKWYTSWIRVVVKCSLYHWEVKRNANKWMQLKRKLYNSYKRQPFGHRAPIFTCKLLLESRVCLLVAYLFGAPTAWPAFA